jgi:hypothetical protein
MWRRNNIKDMLQSDPAKYFTRRFTMLDALKKLFGIKAAEKAAPAPYKVEAPAKPAKKVAVKKTPVKKAPAKPRKPKGNI